MYISPRTFMRGSRMRKSQTLAQEMATMQGQASLTISPGLPSYLPLLVIGGVILWLVLKK